MEDGPEAAAAVAEQVSELPAESYPVVLKLDSLAVASLLPQDSPVRQEFDPLQLIRPIAAAVELMGVPPGSSPAEVGKTKTYPLPAAQEEKHP